MRKTLFFCIYISPKETPKDQKKKAKDRANSVRKTITKTAERFMQQQQSTSTSGNFDLSIAYQKQQHELDLLRLENQTLKQQMKGIQYACV